MGFSPWYLPACACTAWPTSAVARRGRVGTNRAKPQSRCRRARFLHELHDLAVDAAGYVIRGIMFDIFETAKLARPLGARQLTRRVRIEQR